MSTDLRHRLGRAGEAFAARHLEHRGFEILARNHRTRWGEIDLIACDGRTLVFVEVKTRRAGRSASPWEALGEAKRRQVRRMAAAWLTGPGERPFVPELRFDAIGVVVDASGAVVALEHLEGAF